MECSRGQMEDIGSHAARSQCRGHISPEGYQTEQWQPSGFARPDSKRQWVSSQSYIMLCKWAAHMAWYVCRAMDGPSCRSARLKSATGEPAHAAAVAVAVAVAVAGTQKAPLTTALSCRPNMSSSLGIMGGTIRGGCPGCSAAG